jgi:hypothetical protein
LRHFFAQVSESAWPSVVFGTHKPFTIMNYGAQSELSAADRSDRTLLYQSAWTGTLTAVNGPPSSSSSRSTDRVFASGPGLCVGRHDSLPPTLPAGC